VVGYQREDGGSMALRNVGILPCNYLKSRNKLQTG